MLFEEIAASDGSRGSAREWGCCPGALCRDKRSGRDNNSKSRPFVCFASPLFFTSFKPIQPSFLPKTHILITAPKKVDLGRIPSSSLPWVGKHQKGCPWFECPYNFVASAHVSLSILLFLPALNIRKVSFLRCVCVRAFEGYNLWEGSHKSRKRANSANVRARFRAQAGWCGKRSSD